MRDAAMDEKMVVEEFDLAYAKLKRVVMEDRYLNGGSGQKDGAVGTGLTQEFDYRPVFDRANELKEKVKVLEALLRSHPDGSVDISSIRLLKAKGFLFDSLEVIGISDKEYAD